MKASPVSRPVPAAPTPGTSCSPGAQPLTRACRSRGCDRDGRGSATTARHRSRRYSAQWATARRPCSTGVSGTTSRYPPRLRNGPPVLPVTASGQRHVTGPVTGSVTADWPALPGTGSVTAGSANRARRVAGVLSLWAMAVSSQGSRTFAPGFVTHPPPGSLGGSCRNPAAGRMRWISWPYLSARSWIRCHRSPSTSRGGAPGNPAVRP